MIKYISHESDVVSEYYKLVRRLTLTKAEQIIWDNYQKFRYYKRCSICSKVKHINEFYKNRTKKQGRTSACKKCIEEKRKRRIKFMSKYDISSRELEVLKLLYFSREEIAKRLGISRSTVMTHINHLLQKFACSRRHQVIIQALKDKVISIQDFITE